jgi:hypothetical protein
MALFIFAMRWKINLIFVLAATICYCQHGFIRSYNFDKPGAIFTNMLLKEDTLIVTGLVFPDEPPYLQGILFVKMDTFGNVLEYKAHFDSLGKNYAVGTIPCGFLNTFDDSGFLILGNIFEKNEGFVAKLNVNGDLVFLNEYPDNNSWQDHYEKIIELPDGFIIAGDKFHIPGEAEVFIMKIDKSGNKLWEKKYGSLNWYDGFSDIIQTSPNEFVIAAIRNSLQNIPWQQAKYKKWVFAVDSIGNLKWQWESEHDLGEIGINNLHKKPDGNWVYTTTNNIVESDGYMRTQPRFVIRGQQF